MFLKRFLETNVNEDTNSHNIWLTTKMAIKDKFLSMGLYQETESLNNLIFKHEIHSSE